MRCRESNRDRFRFEWFARSLSVDKSYRLELISTVPGGAPEGNQNARKRNRMLTDALKRELTQNPDDVVKVARKLIDSAVAGDSWAQNLIWDRLDGKVPQPVVGDDEEAPITVREILIRAVSASDRSSSEGG
jgi:hypothetical protein